MKVAPKKNLDDDEDGEDSQNDDNEDDEEGSSQPVKKRKVEAGKAKPEKAKK